MNEIKNIITELDNPIIKVWCRDCGAEMKRYPYGMLVFVCKTCKLKAEILYTKLQEVHLK